MKRNILATALISCALVATPTIAANATELCVVDTIHHEAIEEVSHQEYQYKKVIPGTQETFRTEYRFRSRTWIESRQEFKDVKNYQFVDGGTTYVKGQPVGGHWVSAPGTGYNHIPSVIINIVWGPGGVPDQYLGTGSVNLSTYGGPNVTVRYKAYAEDFKGWSDWGPWSDWSAANPGPSNDTRNVESRRTSNNDATLDTTVYYVENGEPTTDLTDANWTTITPAPEGWTFVDKRNVVTTLGEDAYDEDVYGDCPAPELAETGVNDNAWLFAGGGLLLLIAGVSLVTYRNRQKGATEHEQ